VLVLILLVKTLAFISNKFYFLSFALNTLLERSFKEIESSRTISHFHQTSSPLFKKNILELLDFFVLFLDRYFQSATAKFPVEEILALFICRSAF